MKLTLLGTSDFRLDAPLATAGYTVQTNKTTLQLDFGRGNLVNMAKAGIDWRKLDAVLLTHIHPDHISDLFQYLQLFTVSNSFGEIDQDITIYGPKGFEAYYPHLRKVIISLWDKLPTVKELYDEEFTVGDVVIKTLPMKHTIDVAGYRLSAEGKSICYTGDTGPNDNIVELAKDADILLIECSNGPSSDKANKAEEGHMGPEGIAELANRAGVKKVVLTHYPADEQQREKRRAAVAEHFNGEVVAGQDLMEIEI